MMLHQAINIFLILLLMLVATYFYVRSQTRSAGDVLDDLFDSYLDKAKDQREGESVGRITLNDELSAIGLLSQQDRKRFLLQQKLIHICGAVCGLLFSLVVIRAKLVTVLITGTVGFCLGHLIAERRKRALKVAFKESLDYYLPVVMERIVMAVQAGLDIIAAIGVLVDIEETHSKSAGSKVDPVTQLLGLALHFSESGVRFDKALQEVANAIDSSALRHAFVHLAMAQRDGGELVMPLRELSDATQLYYQETVEEEVAKLPVKATLPLVITFAGLIICFITSPIIQVMSITKEMSPGGF